ncbi:MAG: hypothetical protein ACI4PF_04290, partial [Christensenellales bacterium]
KINAVYSDGSKEEISDSSSLTKSIKYIPCNSSEEISKDMQDFMEKIAQNSLNSGTWKITFGFNEISHELYINIDLSEDKPNYILSIKNTLTDETNTMTYGTRFEALDISVKLGAEEVDKSYFDVFYLDLEDGEEYDSTKHPEDYYEENKLQYLSLCDILRAGTYKVCARVQQYGNYYLNYSDFIDFEIEKAKIELVSDPSELVFTFALATADSSEKLEDVTFDEMFYDSEFLHQTRNLPEDVKFIACSDGIAENNDADSTDKLTNEFFFYDGYWQDVSEGTYNAGTYTLTLRFVPNTEYLKNFEFSDEISATLNFNKCEINLPCVVVNDSTGGDSPYAEKLQSDGNYITVTSVYTNPIICYTTTVGTTNTMQGAFIKDDKDEIEVAEEDNQKRRYYTHRACGDNEVFTVKLVPFRNFEFKNSSVATNFDERDFTITNGIAIFSWKINPAGFDEIYNASNDSTSDVDPIQNYNVNSSLSDDITPTYNIDGTVDLRIGGSLDASYFDDFDVIMTLVDSNVDILTKDENDDLHYTFKPASTTEYVGSINVRLSIKLKSDVISSLSFSIDNNGIAFDNTLSVRLNPIDPDYSFAIAHNNYAYNIGESQDATFFTLSSDAQVTTFKDIFLSNDCGTWTIEKEVNGTWVNVDMDDAGEIEYSTQENLQRKYRYSFTPKSECPYVNDFSQIEFYLAQETIEQY